MTSVCPNGHDSAADDYCDTCGAPIGAAPAASGAPAASSPGSVVPSGDSAAPASSTPGEDESGLAPDAPAAQICPNCATRNLPDALFCEACGYDFTTGVMPRPIALADGSFLELDPPARPASPATPAAPTGSGSSGASALDLGEERAPKHAASAVEKPDVAAPQPDSTSSDDADEPARDADLAAAAAPTPDASAPPATSATPAPDSTPSAAAGEKPDPEPRATPAAAPARPAGAAAPTPSAPAAPLSASDATSSAPSTGRRPTYRPPSREIGGDWVVEVWIDPEWYDVQDSDDVRPSPAVPDIVRLRSSTVMVGRPSASRNIRPDIDCGSDTGVSRRQAQLSSDGRRWWIEDLGSSNGTYVGPASGPLPVDPLEPGRRVEVDADDRVYVGAWTRLVVRKATESEVADL